jgi:hypothetical protein
VGWWTKIALSSSCLAPALAQDGHPFGYKYELNTDEYKSSQFDGFSEMTRGFCCLNASILKGLLRSALFQRVRLRLATTRIESAGFQA